MTPDIQTTPAFPGFALRPGSRGPHVAVLQRRLLELGHDEVGLVDGVFGPRTEAAVRVFQARRAAGRRWPYAVDGVVGPATWRALFEMPTQDSLTALLARAVEGGGSLRSAAQSVAEQLRGPNLDWRHLARALDEVRGQTGRQAQGAATALLDRVAVLAMQLAQPERHPDAEAEKTAADMLSACWPGRPAREMLHDILNVLRLYLDFDVATYAEYHHGDGTKDDPPLVRARLALDGKEEFRWPARWLELPSTMIAWAEGKERVIGNIDKFFDERPETGELRKGPVAEEYKRRGVVSMLVASRLDSGRLIATLTLGRRKEKPAFTKADQDRLDALRVEQVLRRVGEAYADETAAIVHELTRLFKPEADPIGLAREMVRLLCEGFGWEYVGVFRVNRTSGDFELVVQHDPTGELAVNQNYSQPLSKGMLGATLEKDGPLYARDVRTVPPPYGYIPNERKTQASAMCFPVRLGKDRPVEWILDLEASQTDAFPRPEQETLARIVEDVEHSLQLWFEARLNNALVEMVGVGVVVLGEGTRIERANTAARRLLGLPVSAELPQEPPFCQLDRYAADKETEWELQGRPPRGAGASGEAGKAQVGQTLPIGAHLRLLGRDGVERRALAGAHYRDSAFHRRVWVLEDVEQGEWLTSLAYMEGAVRTVVAQSRSRLLLAGALLRRAMASSGLGTAERDLLQRAGRALASADISYERIALTRDALAIKELDGKPVRLDLVGFLRAFRASLPEEDAAALEFDLPDTSLSVEADRELLPFALRSLLGYLLAIRPPASALRLLLSRAGGQARIEIRMESGAGPWRAGTAPPPEVQDALAQSEAQAVASASHGLEAVRAVLAAHGGGLADESRDGTLVLVLTGPRLAAVAERLAS